MIRAEGRNAFQSVTTLHHEDSSRTAARELAANSQIDDSPARVSRVEPFRPEVILGPPGCGKTTALMQEAMCELEAGLSPNRLALVTFTRAARQEALERAQRALGLAPERLPWMRTIHSTAFGVLECSPDKIVDDVGWQEFAKRHGYRLTGVGHQRDGDTLERVSRQRATSDDLLLAAYDWGRNRLLCPQRTLARFPLPGLRTRPFLRFVERAEKYKIENGLLDFCDLLERAWESAARPTVDVAMVDEAHDLSPLQIRLVTKWFAPCRRVVIAGDDDQAIYVFGGADPNWLLRLTGDRQPTVLSRSHRVPIAAHALAQRIIHTNRRRVPKAYEPRDAPGEVLELDLDGALDAIDPRESTFILVRNRYFMRRPAAGLVTRVTPFVAEGWGAASPLSDSRLVAAVRLGCDLANGNPGPFPTDRVEAFLSFVPANGEFIERGIKAEIRRRLGQGSFTRQQLYELGLEPLLARLAPGDPFSVLQLVAKPRRRYLQSLLARYGGLPVPQVVLTTIHAAKGREAETVILIPDMARATYDEYVRGKSDGRESETRVFYVGVTRTRRRLLLVRPLSRKHFDFPRIRALGGRP